MKIPLNVERDVDLPTYEPIKKPPRERGPDKKPVAPPPPRIPSDPVLRELQRELTEDNIASRADVEERMRKQDERISGKTHLTPAEIRYLKKRNLP